MGAEVVTISLKKQQVVRGLKVNNQKVRVKVGSLDSIPVPKVGDSNRNFGGSTEKLVLCKKQTRLRLGSGYSLNA